jgi:hypothetical protein
VGCDRRVVGVGVIAGVVYLKVNINKFIIYIYIYFKKNLPCETQGGGECETVFAEQGKGAPYQQRAGTRENITVIVTICANGTSTPPAIIFKGSAYQVKWSQNNPLNAS